MISKFFINRPIFATVIAILMIIIGGITIFTLPVAQYPDITPPTVQVSAVYPGASAETVAKTVGVPIEAQVNGVEGMMYMSSTSSADGSYKLTITFEVGTDIDMATVMVQNRVAVAQGSLPEAVIQQGITTQKQSTNIVLFVSLEGDSTNRYNSLYLSNYANLNVVDALSRINGVGGVNVFGAGNYSMRIWLDPEAMRVRSVTPSDVYQAIQAQNMEVSAGSVGAPPTKSNEAFQFTVTSQGRLVTTDQFGDIIIRANSDGSILRLKDIAKIDLGSIDYNTVSNVSGRETALIAIYQLPGANALDVAKNVKKELNNLQQYFPKGVKYKVILDTTNFVNASIDEVLKTLLETSLIVMLVMLLFLQNWRAVLIPMITIPVSLIATFAVMKLLGFTINTLTLFGLVLAIAIVVDDAIVVVEDCMRLIDTGKYTRKEATYIAMEELQGPIIGEVLVLLAVFVPTAFIGGITGQLYKQFALTIAISTAFSGINALTLSPALCALFLKQSNSDFIIYRYFNKYFASLKNLYQRIIGKFLKRPIATLGVFIALALLGFWGLIKWPSSYIPSEDMGYFMTSVQLPSGASLERTEKVVNEVEQQLLSIPEVEEVIAISGFSFMGGGASSNGGSLFVVLKPWKERKNKNQTVFAIVDKANAMTSQIQSGIIFSINPPAIPGLGNSGGLEMELLDINNEGASEMQKAIADIITAASTNEEIASVSSLYQGNIPQYQLNIDRNKLEIQSINLSDVYNTLNLFLGQAFVNDFVEFGRIFQVKIGADSKYRSRIDDILKLSVKNANGDMVPFSSFTTIEPTLGLSNVTRYNMYPSASITFNPAENVSSSDGIKTAQEIVSSTLGNNYAYSWTGQAYQETQAGATITIVLIFAVIITILVLAAQYESWTDPIAVVLSMPIAILGTVLGCMIMGESISIYTQIGIILLLGLSAKNAILIVEYATDYRRKGESIYNSALDAGGVRFRPIIMTSLAFVVGILPLMFATGAGAESRISLGTAVVFGMALNAIIGTLFVPNFWDVMQRIQERFISPNKLESPSENNNSLDHN
jgi:hydrophobe/amphiphile efflux-1 (HAE1) family protein